MPFEPFVYRLSAEWHLFVLWGFRLHINGCLFSTGRFQSIYGVLRRGLRYDGGWLYCWEPLELTLGYQVGDGSNPTHRGIHLRCINHYSTGDSRQPRNNHGLIGVHIYSFFLRCRIDRA